jgi:hypothetical protein
MIRKANGQNLRITANAQVGSTSACLSETILGSVTLPPDFLSAGAIITVRNSCAKSAATGVFVVKLYFNTTASLTGALQLGTYTTLSTDRAPGVYRRFLFNTATTAVGLDSTFSTSNDVGDVVGATAATLSFTNWLVGGGVFFITGLRSSGTDTLQLINISLEV